MIYENILYGYDYDSEKNILIGREDIKDYGFFSTFTLLLTSIMVVHGKFGKTPDNIDGTNLLRKLKKNDDKDVYHYFFHIDKTISIDLPKEIPVPYSPNDHHTIYKEENSKFYDPFFRKYFNVNENIISKILHLKNKYSIEENNTIAVIFRDSDKWTDMGGFNYVSAAGYLRMCKDVIENVIEESNQRPKIIIQSENQGVVETFQQAFGAIFLSETSLGNPSDVYPPIPLNDDVRMEWAEYYIASLWLLSKCKYVITYTGNSEFFVYLNRGTTNNLIQEITFTKNYKEFFTKNN